MINGTSINAIVEMKCKMISNHLKPKYLFMNPMMLHELIQKYSTLLSYNDDYIEIFGLNIVVDSKMEDYSMLVTEQYEH